MDVVSPFVVVGGGLSRARLELAIVVGVNVGGEVKVNVVDGDEDAVGGGDEVWFDVVGA